MSMPAYSRDRAEAAAPHAQMISSDEVFSAVGVGMTFSAGEEIYAQDDETDMVYQVQRGAVRASRLLGDGRRQIAGFYYPGDLFGLEAGLTHRASAEARSARAALPGWTPDKAGQEALKDRLVRHLIDTGCFRLGDFVLKSGKKSPFYIDLRRLISKPQALEAAGQAYAALARSCRYDRLAGIPAAALPLATAAGLALSVPMIWPALPSG